jgi:hypothetical protein
MRRTAGSKARGSPDIMSVDHGGPLLYRCRLCDEVYPAYHVPNITVALAHLIHGADTPESWGPRRPALLNVHACKGEGNTRLGVSDLVGGRSDE